MTQLISNVLFTSSVYFLSSFSFSLQYSINKSINISHALSFVISAYLLHFFYVVNSHNLFISILTSLIIVQIVALSTFYLIRKFLGKSNLIVLILTLGIYIVFQNFISILFGDNLLMFNNSVGAAISIFGITFTLIQLVSCSFAFFFFLISNLVFIHTSFGLKYKAVSSNNVLSEIYGINLHSVNLYSYAVSSFIGSIVGFITAFDTGILPTMGFNLLLYGIVAMIIGGVNSSWGLIGGSLLLATAQHLGAFYIDSKWMDAIAYIILILFLIWKPLGFSGKRLKKTEI